MESIFIYNKHLKTP